MAKPQTTESSSTHAGNGTHTNGAETNGAAAKKKRTAKPKDISTQGVASRISKALAGTSRETQFAALGSVMLSLGQYEMSGTLLGAAQKAKTEAVAPTVS